ncbi:ribosomal RNA-processing protein 17-like [Momordica charantia]|uniref:Ribosomal RNA-processing protein 17-like n=1 Tax=Momordica charantia TaxID=3673 RepID=A0A6J1CL67_MOMCH|nr:ribosomal RNA-processing protein 17-like [Momordica charantia]XP_022142096.1 ribosomal RNA-processing protein 17-like [Momordica charantia]
MVKNDGDEGGELAQPRGRHIKKRALKNKALAVSFNEKDLRDYVTGFHKRKKKRRKEAEKQQEEAKRRKRIELRKKRKEEKELVLYGGILPADRPVDEQNDDHEEEEEKPFAPISETTTYDSGNIKVTVITSEVSRDGEICPIDKSQTATTQLVAKDKKHNLPITKKKPFKKVAKQKSRPKPRSKRDKKKGRKKK